MCGRVWVASFDDASALLLEAPAGAAAHGSRMLSANNDDGTAANVWRAYQHRAAAGVGNARLGLIVTGTPHRFPWGPPSSPTETNQVRKAARRAWLSGNRRRG